MNIIEYNTGPYTWSLQQFELLKNNQLDKLDVEGLRKAIRFYINDIKYQLQTYVKYILLGMLKQKHNQLDHDNADIMRSGIRKVKILIRAFPSLKNTMMAKLDDNWQWAKGRYCMIHKPIIADIPESCPWTLEDMLPDLSDVSERKTDRLVVLGMIALFLPVNKVTNADTLYIARVLLFIRNHHAFIQSEHMADLVTYLLGYTHTEEKRNKKWLARQCLRDHKKAQERLAKDPKIKDVYMTTLSEKYQEIRLKSVEMVNLPMDISPEVCPWSLDDILDSDFITSLTSEKP